MDTHVVIMAGGIGSRLWPASTPSTPKQFIDILGVGSSLLQLTMERFLPVCSPRNFWVVTSERYSNIVRDQLPSVPPEQILLEPEPRNTAPCIAYACRKISVLHPEANIVVTPADAIVMRTEGFIKAIKLALEHTENSSDIVTLGISPSRPETGYGYICAESVDTGKVVKVKAFKEKPCLETAKKYLALGNYFWNAGIFVWNVQTINLQLSLHAPSITAIMDKLEPSFYTPDESELLAELFPLCEKISIDYAVMEKADGIYVVAGDYGWSDLGSWGSVASHLPSDGEGNAVVGKDVRLFECEGCVVHAGDARIVAVQGLKDYVVAVNGGNVLVCRKSEEQRIKEFSASKKIGTSGVEQGKA